VAKFSYQVTSREEQNTREDEIPAHLPVGTISNFAANHPENEAMKSQEQ
jgi:hypothetical protein